MTHPQPADPLISAAVVVYLGWGRAGMPIADESGVADLAQREGADPAILLRGVHDAIEASDRLEVTDLPENDDGGEALYKRRLRDSRPDLSPDAVDALASRWFFTLRWLGIEAGSDVPRYFVRYGGEGPTPIPISLFRRRTVDGRPVDEVLRDVDDWRADDRRQIEYALIFTLDSNLEEVTADEAAQFQEMVRTRNYVPFRDTRAQPAMSRTTDAETTRATGILIDPHNERASAQHREETLATIRAEGLSGYRWFEDATNDTDIVAIQRTGSGWAVFATDERATVRGRREFTEQGPALENFLSRLRALNRVAVWHEKVRHDKASRYFVQERRVDGRLVPARLFRRRQTATGPVDEMLADVDTWHPDTRGMLDRAIRFPLDSDLEEISDAAAREIFAMVARRE